MNKPTVLANGKCAVAGYLNETWKNSNFAAVEGAFRDLDAERGSTCYVSSDKGLTWEMRGTVPFPANDWNETSVVELGDGVLRMFARVCADGCGKIMVADSKDEGRTWTKPYELKSMNNPNARFQVQRLKSGRLLFVKHGAPTTGGTAWQHVDGLRPKCLSSHQPTVSNQSGLAAEHWLLNTEALRAKRASVALERDQVVRELRDDPPDDLALAPRGVDRDDAAHEVNGLRPKCLSSHQPTVSNQSGLAAEHWLLNTEALRAKRGSRPRG